MNLQEFKNSISNENPPENISDVLKALWFEKKGEWKAAHEIAQTEKTLSHDLIHAYLHRVEGDNGNANYWYNRAKREMPKLSLNEEWEKMVDEFLK